jgi:hypothetical protein
MKVISFTHWSLHFQSDAITDCKEEWGGSRKPLWTLWTLWRKVFTDDGNPNYLPGSPCRGLVRALNEILMSTVRLRKTCDGLNNEFQIGEVEYCLDNPEIFINSINKTNHKEASKVIESLCTWGRRICVCVVYKCDVEKTCMLAKLLWGSVSILTNMAGRLKDFLQKYCL